MLKYIRKKYYLFFFCRRGLHDWKIVKKPKYIGFFGTRVCKVCKYKDYYEGTPKNIYREE